ncbi:DUF3291 domain-containing protein [Nocardiopsis xinjiangensis]|uniref:DUF3291 domain-containing protein n=1 Tax=Nocardiopsis xinjiangensis TaxID=124285 RepID=UPI00034620B8|nr:DUF3291 domain-containing protein [Nocardiopsis xinjiangensis]
MTTSFRLAFTTFAVMKEPYGSAVTKGFEDLTGPTFEEAERHPGFLSRAISPNDDDQNTNFGKDYGPWGEFDVPRFYVWGRTEETDRRASTLSLWKDLESVHAFVYTAPLHKSALRQRHDWFVRPEWPSYALWWVAEEETPTWKDASVRLELLHDNGPTHRAFDFRHPFSPQGEPMETVKKSRARP